MLELEYTFDADASDAPVRQRPAGAGVLDRVEIRRRAQNALEAEQLIDMLDYVEAARADGAQISPAIAQTAAQAAVHDLSLVLTLAPGVIARQLAQARRLRGQLPHVWSGFCGGSFSSWHARVIDQQCQRLTRPESYLKLDEAIAEYAAAHTPTQLQRWLCRQVERIESDAAAERHRRARAQRHVRLTPAGDGMAWLSALIPELDASAICSRLDSEARHSADQEGRTHDQKVADIFTDLLLGSPDPDNPRRGASTVIGITVPLPSLLGVSETPGETSDRAFSVPAELVRAKALEPGTLFYRLLTDEHGHLLDATRLGRFATGGLREALAFRDGTSAFPTSTVPAAACDIDHHDPWPAPTRGDNLSPVNRRVHRLKTDGHYSVRRTSAGATIWTTRTGHSFIHTPDPLPVEVWPEPLM